MRDREGLFSPKFWLGGTAVLTVPPLTSSFGGKVPSLALWDLRKCISQFIILKQSFLSCSSPYIWPVAYLVRPGPPYKNICLKIAPFHLKTMIHVYIHTHIHAYYNACMGTYMHAYTHACIHTYIYIQRYIQRYTYIHSFTYAYVHTHTCAKT